MSEPTRVAHVVGKMCGGGVEAVVMNYYRHIDRSRVQFDFLVDEDSALVPREEIGSLGGRVFVVPPYQRLLAYMGRLEGLFSDEGCPLPRQRALGLPAARGRPGGRARAHRPLAFDGGQGRARQERAQAPAAHPGEPLPDAPPRVLTLCR